MDAMKIPGALLLVLIIQTTFGEPVNLGSRRELFADDALIARVSGDVRQKLH